MASFGRGSVVLVNLPYQGGAEKFGNRPCLVVQNDDGNSDVRWPLLIVVPITGRPARYVADVPVKKGDGGLLQDSTIDCTQIMTLDKSKVTRTVGNVAASTLAAVEQAIRVTLDLV